MGVYHPFGMVMPGRQYQTDQYRYGFNGQESDGEVKGDGNSYDFGARMLDVRIGKFLSIDALFQKYPSVSPYTFGNSNPILYKDIDGNDWIYYDNQGNEQGRTLSKWYHFHWLTGDKKIVLSNDELKQGGFFGYVTFTEGGKHASLVDIQTGDLYELRHPVIGGEPVNGSEYKDDYMTWGKGQVSKFEGSPEYEFANKEWWTYKVKNEDGSYSDKSPDEVGVTYIWMPNRGAVLSYLESRIGTSREWFPDSNCKTFCTEAMMHGYEGVTDQNHLDIKENLEDEDVNPGEWYNEFEPNKYIKNPEKNKDE